MSHFFSFFIMAKKFLDVIGTIILAIGMFLAFLPHAVHISVGLNNETSHAKHVIIGIVLIVIALAILVYNNDALNREFLKKFIRRN